MTIPTASTSGPVPASSASRARRRARRRERRATRRNDRLRRLAALIGVLVAVAVSIVAVRVHVASADAGFGSGRRNVTTDGFTHPWLGAYVTNVGLAWCIDSGRGYPRAAGNHSTVDVPATRGVGLDDRFALAYALWAYGASGDPTIAAGLATVVHGLSGDTNASVNVPAMRISDPAVRNAALAIHADAKRRSHWVSSPQRDPWRVATRLEHLGALDWRATTTVTTASGRPIAGHRVGLVPGNVTDGPGVEHIFSTDGNGRIVTTWSQADAVRPITIGAQTTAPMYYSVWQGPTYPSGLLPQRVVTPNGTIYRGIASADLPTGRIQLHKTTDNPHYQQATGATFDVHAAGGSPSRGTLTVGPDGSSNTLTLPVGTYVAIETSAPPGVRVDATPHAFEVSENTTAGLSVVDPVERRAGLRLAKVDAVTGESVAGARLVVARDTDADGTYDETIGEFTSGTSPVEIPALAAGRFRVTEVAAPDGYELPTDPAETSRIVTLAWDQTATVSFADHRSIAVTTRTGLDDDRSAPAPPAGSANTAHVVGPIGGALHDTVTVRGLAPQEVGTVSVELFGPVAPDAAPVCDAAHRVFTDTWRVTGSGDSTSGSFTPTLTGRYTWVATLDVPGVGPVSGPCGEVSESAIITPTITTVAQAPSPRGARAPGASTADPGPTATTTPGPTSTTTTTTTTTTTVPSGSSTTTSTSVPSPSRPTSTPSTVPRSAGNDPGSQGATAGPATGRGGAPDKVTAEPVASSAGAVAAATLGVVASPKGTPGDGSSPRGDTGSDPGTRTLPDAAADPGTDPAPTPPGPTASFGVRDRMSATGLPVGTSGTLRTALYGPFASIDDISQACATGTLGDPVGVVVDPFEATGPTTTVDASPIDVDDTDSAAGWYTFVAQLDVHGYGTVSHDCGTPSETFQLTATPTPPTTILIPPASTTAPPPSSTTTTPAPTTTTPPTSVAPTTPPATPTAPPDNAGSGSATYGELPRTGSAVGPLVGFAAAAIALGAGAVAAGRRRRSPRQGRGPLAR